MPRTADPEARRTTVGIALSRREAEILDDLLRKIRMQTGREVSRSSLLRDLVMGRILNQSNVNPE